ncbi:hypothetical protein GCM10009731_28030 [Streptomyces globosus]
MGGQGHLVDAVGGLREQPYGEQVAEIPQAQEYAQITYDGHEGKVHTCGGSPGRLPGDPGGTADGDRGTAAPALRTGPV